MIFLLGCNKFTVLVELKRPDTDLFKDKNRSNSWSLSTELIDAFSQILEQKASWQIQAESNANNNYNDNGEIIKQKTVDPKTILIIGNLWIKNQQLLYLFIHFSFLIKVTPKSNPLPDN